jgi:hypothetical protein
MSRNRSKSADTHHMPNTYYATEAIQILLIDRLGLLFDLKSFTECNLSTWIHYTEQRLRTNKIALSRLLPQQELDTLIETSNEILNLALYLKHHKYHTIGTEKLDVLQYLINMYDTPK